MSRTDAVTRILFEAFPTAEVRLFYALGYTAIGIFCWGVYVQIRKYRRGAALVLEGSLWSRAGDMVGKVLSHRTVDRRDHAAGGAHRLIFYGFGLLFLGTATITLQYDILEPLFGIRFWQGEFYLIFSLVLDIAGSRAARRAALYDVSARLDEAAQARLRAARPLARRSGFPPPGVPARGLGLPLDAGRHRLHRLSAGGRASGVAPGAAGRVGYALVVARGRGHRRGARRRRPDGARRRRAQALALVVSWHARAHFHRAHPLHQGEAHLHRGRLVDGARPESLAAPAARARDAGNAGGRQDHRLHLEAAAEPRCLHQVRPLSRSLPRPRGGRPSVAARRHPELARVRERRPRVRHPAAGGRARASTASRRARWRWRRCGPAAPAWPASRSVRWPSSTSPSSCRCAASWSRTAPWIPCSPRRCRPSTRPATRSANRSASAARGPRHCRSRSRTRARSRSISCGSSATTPRSIRAIRG